MQNPELLFQEADAFLIASFAVMRKASDYAASDDTWRKALAITYAAHVNHAFAFEMYLKCLIVIEGTEISKDNKNAHHNLEGLFGLLKDETQKRIISDFNKTTYFSDAYFKMIADIQDYLPKKVEFIDLLKRSPKAFTELRYKFEQRAGNKSYELESAINSVRVVILSLRPDIQGYY